MVAPVPFEIPATLPDLPPKASAAARLRSRAGAFATPLLLITYLQAQWIQRIAHSLAQRRCRMSSIISKFETLSIVTGVVPLLRCRMLNILLK